VSPVAKQTTSNTVVAMRDVTQVCFDGFSILIERAAVIESERYLLVLTCRSAFRTMST